jgi:hypothetical protein
MAKAAQNIPHIRRRGRPPTHGFLADLLASLREHEHRIRDLLIYMPCALQVKE